MGVTFAPSTARVPPPSHVYAVNDVEPRFARRLDVRLSRGALHRDEAIDVTKPSTINSALGGHMKRELRQQIMKRMVRDLPNLMPFMVGAAVGAVMNRRDTRRLADRIRKDLRTFQVPWDQLPGLPPLQPPADALDLGNNGPKELRT